MMASDAEPPLPDGCVQRIQRAMKSTIVSTDDFKMSGLCEGCDNQITAIAQAAKFQIFIEREFRQRRHRRDADKRHRKKISEEAMAVLSEFIQKRGKKILNTPVTHISNDVKSSARHQNTMEDTTPGSEAEAAGDATSTIEDQSAENTTNINDASQNEDSETPVITDKKKMPLLVSAQQRTDSGRSLLTPKRKLQPNAVRIAAKPKDATEATVTTTVAKKPKISCGRLLETPDGRFRIVSHKKTDLEKVEESTQLSIDSLIQAAELLAEANSQSHGQLINQASKIHKQTIKRRLQNVPQLQLVRPNNNEPSADETEPQDEQPGEAEEMESSASKNQLSKALKYDSMTGFELGMTFLTWPEFLQRKKSYSDRNGVTLNVRHSHKLKTDLFHEVLRPYQRITFGCLYGELKRSKNRVVTARSNKFNLGCKFLLQLRFEKAKSAYVVCKVFLSHNHECDPNNPPKPKIGCKNEKKAGEESAMWEDAHLSVGETTEVSTLNEEQLKEMIEATEHLEKQLNLSAGDTTVKGEQSNQSNSVVHVTKTRYKDNVFGFELGSTFLSWPEVIQRKESYSKRNGVYLPRWDSLLLKGDQYDKDLHPYKRVQFGCSKGISRKQKADGKSRGEACPFMVTVRFDRDKCAYVVSKCNLEHNHVCDPDDPVLPPPPKKKKSPKKSKRQEAAEKKEADEREAEQRAVEQRGADKRSGAEGWEEEMWELAEDDGSDDDDEDEYYSD